MRYLGKLIVAKGLQKLPKVQKIAQSGHTGLNFKLYDHVDVKLCFVCPFVNNFTLYITLNFSR